MKTPDQIKAILSEPAINNTPFAVALYPDLTITGARAKLHHKLHYAEELKEFECILITDMLTELKSKL